ncbi:MAG: hypothetical protein LBT82_01560 [Oscillospiraceae bacterium]|jgi:hypothetical protein|nr:hypothetical protein [Oscillospiraceae bacterium]
MSKKKNRKKKKEISSVKKNTAATNTTKPYLSATTGGTSNATSVLPDFIPLDISKSNDSLNLNNKFKDKNKIFSKNRDEKLENEKLLKTFQKNNATTNDSVDLIKSKNFEEKKLEKQTKDANVLEKERKKLNSEIKNLKNIEKKQVDVSKENEKILKNSAEFKNLNVTDENKNKKSYSLNEKNISLKDLSQELLVVFQKANVGVKKYVSNLSRSLDEKDLQLKKKTEENKILNSRIGTLEQLNNEITNFRNKFNDVNTELKNQQNNEIEHLIAELEEKDDSVRELESMIEEDLSVIEDLIEKIEYEKNRADENYKKLQEVLKNLMKKA